MKFTEKIKQFLAGRYGTDALNTGLSILALICFIAAAITGRFSNPVCLVISIVLYLAAIAALGWSFFRTFSRDLVARQKENDWFRSNVLAPFRRKKKELETRRSQKETHRFFKCPKCRQTVRVPRGKGKVKITCPKCGEKFIKET